MKKRPFKISFSKNKDGNMKIDIEGTDPIGVASLFAFIDIAKKGVRLLENKLSEIASNLPVKKH